MNILLEGGRIVDPANSLDTVSNLYIRDNLIIAIADSAPDGFTADRRIDVSGMIVCPGLVDLRTRLREPGQEYKATIASETRKAAASGITTLCCPPDTRPVIDTPAVVELIHQRAGDAGFARVEVIGALTRGLSGEQLAEMGALKETGVCGVSNADNNIRDSRILQHAYDYARTFDLTVFIHPADPWLAMDGCMHEGAISTRHGLPGIPETAETIALARDLLMMEQTGVRGHIGHLSAARSVSLLSQARNEQLPVSADVCIHHLFLTELDAADFNSQCHLYPPLRSQRDRQALRDAVGSQLIEVITSDHQPHDFDAKLAPFPLTEPGMEGLELLLPLTLRLVEEEVMSLNDAIAAVTCNPARVLGVNSGTLSTGSTADICVIDPNMVWRVPAGDGDNDSNWLPYAGWELRGRSWMTLHNGNIVYEHDAE